MSLYCNCNNRKSKKVFVSNTLQYDLCENCKKEINDSITFESDKDIAIRLFTKMIKSGLARNEDDLSDDELLGGDTKGISIVLNRLDIHSNATRIFVTDLLKGRYLYMIFDKEGNMVDSGFQNFSY